MTRTNDFGISFCGGLAEGWAFGVPESFRNSLDIRYTRRVDQELTQALRERQPATESGTPWTVFHMGWSRGEPPLLTFAKGHVFIDPASAYHMDRPTARRALRRSVRVVDAEPDDMAGSGWVKVAISCYEQGKLIRIKRCKMLQSEFETFLRAGRMPAGREAEPKPSVTTGRSAASFSDAHSR